MTLLYWAVGLAAMIMAASTLALWSYGRFARLARGATAHALPRQPDATPLDRIVAPLEAAHADRTGLANVLDGREAFALRALSARAAGRSLDMMYYLWRDDMTGRLLARELIAAADRGVRVRLVLDDINVQGFDPSYLALDDHPNIEVRLFNPIRNRHGALRRGLEILLGIVRFNRRLHSKMWIADGRLGVIGGRNVGDSDFDAVGRRARRRKRDARDADLLMAGAALGEAERLFDAYWNSGITLPISALWKGHVTSLDWLRRRLDDTLAGQRVRGYLGQALGTARTLPGRPDTAADDLAPRARSLRWTDTARVLADPPEKALGSGRSEWMPEAMQPLFDGARESLQLATPYFVPGRDGMATLRRLLGRGIRLSVVTNALSATNHIIVHGAYRRYRRPLLAAGAQLYEFAPGRPRQRATRSEPHAMLHAKYFIVDRRLALVGSFNFDMRSIFLNTEMGVVFEEPVLVEELARDFDSMIAPGQSYTLSLETGQLRWVSPLKGGAVSLDREPGAPRLRRAITWAIGHLPIHSYL
ncbi:phospholipase [Rhodobacteraceae bacterium WD3A24]|nr:phospholipase [Rhodobacteraceae bacterium WD3A24]